MKARRWVGPWVRLAHDWYRDPKMDKVSAEAATLFLAAIGYAHQNQTDGRLSRRDVKVLGLVVPMISDSDVDVLAEQLATADLWAERGDGWQITKYEDWQETAAERRERRDAARVRYERWKDAPT